MQEAPEGLQTQLHLELELELALGQLRSPCRGCGCDPCRAHRLVMKLKWHLVGCPSHGVQLEAQSGTQSVILYVTQLADCTY